MTARAKQVEHLLAQLSDALRPYGVHQITLDLKGNNPPAVALEDEHSIGIGDNFNQAIHRLNRHRLKVTSSQN